MTDPRTGVRLVGSLLLWGLLLWTWDAYGFRVAVIVWLLWFTQTYLYNDVWDDWDGDA